MEEGEKVIDGAKRVAGDDGREGRKVFCCPELGYPQPSQQLVCMFGVSVVLPTLANTALDVAAYGQNPGMVQQL